ncbi:MAG: prepilin-type N-terminal cleavage/methylation domain-containing protein [Acidobacteria bacterium]|nr:prepilin-type N-terminal cleavage/methylation domain-containing protein [Acidobacteriota bacterium]
MASLRTGNRNFKAGQVKLRMNTSEITKKDRVNGYSIIELMIAMTITLVMLGLVATLLGDSLGMRERESRKTDALTSAQAALNVMSYEISNSGFGLTSNGIVIADSNRTQLHFRSNIENDDLSTNSPGEDVTYYVDSATASIVRYDPHAAITTSTIINRISSVAFQYFDYTGSNSTPTMSYTPTNNTGRIRIIITVELEDVEGQPDDQIVTFKTDITLRNSNYMLNQY